MRRATLVACVASAVLAGTWIALRTPVATTGAPASASAGVVAAADTAAPPAYDRVTVQQELVNASVTAERAPARAAAAKPAVVKPAVVAKRTARKEGFLGKVRRALFGGGRHKPSPFPAAEQ